MSEFKKAMALVTAELASCTVVDVFHTMRRRFPHWAVTPHRVRKTLSALQALKKKRLAKRGSTAQRSNEDVARVFPHDIVELQPHASRSRHAQWQWCGQVLRVAGVDDVDALEEEALPSGHCSVFWLGHNLEQWPSALTKETSVRAVDRPWVLADRVARAVDPRSLGTVVGVHCKLKIAGVPGANSWTTLPVRAVRAVGGFRAEDWVAHEATRSVGRVEEAVFRVEVELCGRSERRPMRNKRHTPPVCVFQVSSEGLQGLEPAGGEDVMPQELSPHFPGQRVKAPARLWRQAEWIRGRLGRRPPRRDSPICGIVTSVECCLLAVQWLGGIVKDTMPPDEWVSPDMVRVITMPNSSEGWVIGDHVQAPPELNAPSAVVVESSTVVSVRWADGKIEMDLSSLDLCPRPHISAHDFLPGDFVSRSGDGFETAAVSTATPHAADVWQSNQNTDDAYGETERARSELLPEILPESPLGVVTCVNQQARTAEVQWSTLTGALESEEVSVFELTNHPTVDVRLGDAVLIPEASDMQWAGRVCAIQSEGHALVELLDGTAQWCHVRRLIVVEGGEGSESVDDSDGSQSDGSDSVASVPGNFEVPAFQESTQCRDADELESDAVEQDVSVHESGNSAPSTTLDSEARDPVEHAAFDVCDEDVDPSDHHFLRHAPLATRVFTAAVRREMVVLRKGLSESMSPSAPIIVRTFSSRTDLFRALVAGPPGTPYADVPFFFDVALPPEYPREPPLAHFHAQYVGNERLNPNLYVDGKVCLSLLGTWSGPTWDPQRSTLLQVLVSLQGLVLVEEPYFNEPGHECDVGTEQGRQASTLYNENARLLALRAALQAAQSPPVGFSEIVASFFSHAGPRLLKDCEEALEEPRASQSSEGFCKVLAKNVLPRLRERWGSG